MSRLTVVLARLALMLRNNCNKPNHKSMTVFGDPWFQYAGMRKIIFLAGLAMATSVAHATGEECIGAHSRAYCMLELAGLSKGAVEISATELNKQIEVSKADYAQSRALDHAIDGLFVVTAKSAFERGLAGTIGILEFIPKAKAIGSLPQFFIMLPESLVKEGNPLRTAESELMKGIVETLGIEAAELREVEKKPTFGSLYIYRDYLLKGGQCGDPGCTAYSRFFTTQPDPVIILDQPPSWAGNERLYVWTSKTKGTWPMVQKLGQAPSLISEESMIALMKNLPGWFYYYIPSKTPMIITGEKVYFLAL